VGAIEVLDRNTIYDSKDFEGVTDRVGRERWWNEAFYADNDKFRFAICTSRYKLAVFFTWLASEGIVNTSFVTNMAVIFPARIRSNIKADDKKYYSAS
jgi:hypothetical protein